MVLTEVTKAEEKRFKQLQEEEGMIPSQALERLEIERRLGTVPEDKKLIEFKKEDWWYYLSLGLIGVAIIYIYMKSTAPAPVAKVALSLPLDNISGIDLESLSICRKEGLM